MRTLFRSLSIFALLASIVSTAAAAEVRLKAIGAHDTGHFVIKSFLSFIDLVNKEGKGVVHIEYLGGPEVIPPNEQGNAIRSGFVDIQHGPPSYYVGQVPGADAVLGARMTPEEMRKNGALAALDAHWRKRINAHLLAIPDTGSHYHIFMTAKPATAANGDPDLSGMKIRISPSYRDVVQKYKGTGISMSAGDVYNALERNVIQGLGWPSIAVVDSDWHKFGKYRLDPGFLNGSWTIIMNQDKWKSMPEPARQLLTRLAAQWEIKSREDMIKAVKAEDEEMRRNGMQSVLLSPEAGKRLMDFAADNVWKSLKKNDAALFEALKGKAY